LMVMALLQAQGEKIKPMTRTETKNNNPFRIQTSFRLLQQ